MCHVLGCHMLPHVMCGALGRDVPWSHWVSHTICCTPGCVARGVCIGSGLCWIVPRGLHVVPCIVPWGMTCHAGVCHAVPVSCPGPMLCHGHMLLASL